ncbi:GerW family sporulation protein [Cellulosilyticum ruminicola]|uniref:GerW family sporulation protein n=1 Tax=Cellulosilyticum ruminicola TaxID=425254 RepID=UPI0006D1A2F3|nr:GerW family sporulation protein [Cellulosilyticum ruminicola]
MENKINKDLNELMSQLENFITTKTVVGEPIHIDDTILVPLVDVSFAAATGATESNNFTERKKEREKNVAGGSGAGAGGIGAKITPSAMLVIQNGTTQLINTRAQDSITKLIDMIPGLVAKAPEFVSHFTEHKGENKVRSARKSKNEAVSESEEKYHQMED